MILKTLPANKYCNQVTDGTHDSPKQTSEGKYLITSKHLSRYNINFQDAYKISIEDYDKIIFRSRVDQYDILYSMIGTIGNIYQEMLPFQQIDYAVKNVGIFKCDNYYRSKWLYYYLQSPEAVEYITSNLKGSTQKYISLGELRNMPIKYVDNDKLQTRIVDVLVSHDNKIRANIEHINILEQIVKQTYQNWFNNYNYPNATDELVFNNQLEREIPSDWDVVPSQRFLTPTSEKIGDTTAPIYSTTNNGIALRDEKFNKNLTKLQGNNKKVVKDDLIFGLSREILNFGVFADEIGSVSPAYQIFKINQNVILPFMLELEMRINMPRYMDILQLGAREGQGIRKDYLMRKYFLVPKMELQEEFFKLYDVLQRKISKLKEENEVLAEIRDTLLPKLMSGELPVKVGEE